MELLLLTTLLTLTTATAIPAPQSCKEGKVKCLATQDNGTDGGVFQCTKGYWKMIQDCRAFEKCVADPTPHCTWAK